VSYRFLLVPSMDPHRSAWIGSTEFTYHTWTPASSLHCPPKSNFPQDLPTLIAFRTYTRATEGSARIGQLNARPNAQDLDEEEEYDLARQEYFYSQQQLTDEASNIVFVTASSGTSSVVVRTGCFPHPATLSNLFPSETLLEDPIERHCNMA
jgi:hypothetical protein